MAPGAHRAPAERAQRVGGLSHEPGGGLWSVVGEAGWASEEVGGGTSRRRGKRRGGVGMGHVTVQVRSPVT